MAGEIKSSGKDGNRYDLLILGGGSAAFAAAIRTSELGGGYIALENAQLFSRLGSKVTIVQRSSHILSDQSEEMGTALTGYLEDEGMTVLTNTNIKEVAKNHTTGKKSYI